MSKTAIATCFWKGFSWGMHYGHALFDTFGPLVSFMYFWSTKKKLCRGPSNEHSYQVWFQLAQWFQRRLKYISLDNTSHDSLGQVNKKEYDKPQSLKH